MEDSVARLPAVLLALLLSAVLLAACGGDDDGADPQAEGEPAVEGAPRVAEDELEPGEGPVAVALEFARLAQQGDGAACEHMAPEYRRRYTELTSRHARERLDCAEAVAVASEEAEDDVSDAEVEELLEAALETGEVVEEDGDRVVVDWPEADESDPIELTRIDGDWLVSGPLLVDDE